MSLVAHPELTLQQPAYLVFSDVDETLITCKSMFDFLRFQLTGASEPRARPATG